MYIIMVSAKCSIEVWWKEWERNSIQKGKLIAQA